MTTIALKQARQHLETLGLKQAVEVLDNTLDAAANKQSTYADVLAQLLGAEVAARRERYLTTKTRMAHLPFQRTLEQFDFGFQPSIDERMVKELASLAFVAEAANILLLGPPRGGQDPPDKAGIILWPARNRREGESTAISRGPPDSVIGGGPNVPLHQPGQGASLAPTQKSCQPVSLSGQARHVDRRSEQDTPFVRYHPAVKGGHPLSQDRLLAESERKLQDSARQRLGYRGVLGHSPVGNVAVGVHEALEQRQPLLVGGPQIKGRNMLVTLDPQVPQPGRETGAQARGTWCRSKCFSPVLHSL